MNVVSNATPVISLARIGRLELLEKLYGRIFITEEVHSETTKHTKDESGAEEISNCPFIEVVEVKNRLSVEMLMTHLDKGESETIVLAKETNADLVIIDERLGRSIAEAKNLKITGTIGVLIEAKYCGLIPQVKKHLDLLREKGTWISDVLYHQIIQQLKE